MLLGVLLFHPPAERERRRSAHYGVCLPASRELSPGLEDHSAKAGSNANFSSVEQKKLLQFAPILLHSVWKNVHFHENS